MKQAKSKPKMMWETRMQEDAQVEPDDHSSWRAIWNGYQAATVRGTEVRSTLCTVNAKHEGIVAPLILLRVSLI